jgi:hypothetical protein
MSPQGSGVERLLFGIHIEWLLMADLSRSASQRQNQ